LWPNPVISFFSVWLDFQNVMTVIFPKQEEDNTHTEIFFFSSQKFKKRRKTGMFKPNKGTITATEQQRPEALMRKLLF
jgi:hypothetical protein